MINVKKYNKFVNLLKSLEYSIDQSDQNLSDNGLIVN